MFVKITDWKYFANFCANIKIIPKASVMHDTRKGEGTWKVDTHLKGNDNVNILRIIITVWLFWQDGPTVLDDSCPLW